MFQRAGPQHGPMTVLKVYPSRYTFSSGTLKAKAGFEGWSELPREGKRENRECIGTMFKLQIRN